MSFFKKKFGIIKAIIITPLIIGLFPGGNVFACSCITPGTPEEEFKKFDAVFMGTVTSISERDVPTSIPREDRVFYPRVKIGIKVGHSWKGVTTDFIYVYTGYGDGDCGYQSTGFETYLFYASGPIDDLTISICSRTSVYREAQEDRKYLEQLNELPLTRVMPQNDDSVENNQKQLNESPFTQVMPQNNEAIEDDQNRMILILGGLTTVLLIVVSYLIMVNQKLRKKIGKQQ